MEFKNPSVQDIIASKQKDKVVRPELEHTVEAQYDQETEMFKVAKEIMTTITGKPGFVDLSRDGLFTEVDQEIFRTDDVSQDLKDDHDYRTNVVNSLEKVQKNLK